MLESLQEELRVSLAEALCIRQGDVEMDKKFIEMGMDSIIGVEWIQTINKHYGIALPATKIYDYPTIREFAGFLAREMKAQNAGAVTKPLGPATSTALDDMLLQVYEGSLDSEQANQRFQEMIRR
jgi:polyketide synthase PksN